MKNSFNRKLLAMILSVALLLNSGTAAFATDGGADGADGAPIVSASETVTTPEETPPAEDVTTESGEQDNLSDPSGSDSVLPREDVDKSACTCDPAPGTSGVEGHGKDCPLYAPPEKPAQSECTCPPVDSGKVVHGKGCPLYIVPTITAEDVLAMINALPTMDELGKVDTKADGFAAYLAQLRLDTAAARAAYNTLTTEEKAVFDADALAKLAALEVALATFPVLMTGGNAITIKVNAIVTEYSGASLSEAVDKAVADNGSIGGYGSINKLTIMTGAVTTDDWTWFGSGTSQHKFYFLEHFTVEPSVTAVADMPDGTNTASIFPTSLNTVSIPKVKKIGSYAFEGCRDLTSASLPAATDIGDNAFVNCKVLVTLVLGATPPSVLSNYVFEDDISKHLEYLNADGTPLADVAAAKAEYKDVDDGNTADNFWYGWLIDDTVTDAITIEYSTDGTDYTRVSALNLEKAFDGVTLSTVTHLKVTEGYLTSFDWNWFNNNGNATWKLPALTHFTVENEVVSVADIPRKAFPATIISVTIPKAKELGGEAFYNCIKLEMVDLPDVITVYKDAFKPDSPRDVLSEIHIKLHSATTIHTNQFSNLNYRKITLEAPKLEILKENALAGITTNSTLKLGATPPIVENGTFATFNQAITLTLVGTDGMTELSDNELTMAQAAYSRAEGKSANRWYGLRINKNMPVNLEFNYSIRADGSLDRPVNIEVFQDIVYLLNDDTISRITNLQLKKAIITSEDWAWFFEADGFASKLTKLANFTIFPEYLGVTNSVANIPAGTADKGLFPKTLVRAALPQVSAIGDYAFSGCDKFTTLVLGTTPPTVAANTFARCPDDRVLKLVSEISDYGTETLLTGDPLKAALVAYRAAPDGNTNDNFWYGWKIQDTTPSVSLASMGLEKAIAAVGDPAMVEKLTITMGDFFTQDWAYLKNLTSLTDFTINAGVGISNPMPDLATGSTFPTSIVNVTIPQALKIGNCAFNGCTALEMLNIPAATSIGDNALNGCTTLTTLKLGATPPTTVGVDAFNGVPRPRSLTLVAADGTTPLAGTALADAVAAYTAIEDGNITDNLWYNWQIDSTKDDPDYPNEAYTSLTLGNTYWFDLSKYAGLGKSTAVHDPSLTYAPFIYAGNLVFGSTNAYQGVSYKLRLPSGGNARASGIITPANNEISRIQEKNVAYMPSNYGTGNGKVNILTQDTSAGNSTKKILRVGTDNNQTFNNMYDIAPDAAYVDDEFNDANWRPVLEIDSTTEDSFKTVTLNMNGGKLNGLTTPMQVVYQGASYQAPPSISLFSAPTNDKAFAGWNTQADGNGTTYKAGATVPNTVTTLYALWLAPEAEWTVTGESTAAKGTLADGFAALATKGGSIKLLADVTNVALTINNSYTSAITLDLNGKNLTSKATEGAFTVSGNTGLLIIKGRGTVTGTQSPAMQVATDGKLVLEGGTYVGSGNEDEAIGSIYLVGDGVTLDNLNALCADGYLFDPAPTGTSEGVVYTDKTVAVVPDTKAPTPQNVKAGGNRAKPTITWEAVAGTGATYDVYQYTITDGTWATSGTKLTASPVSGTSYTLTTALLALSATDSYGFAVVAHITDSAKPDHSGEGRSGAHLYVTSVTAPGGTVDDTPTQEELDAVFGEGGATLDGNKIIIDADITFTGSVTINATPITIDLNGHDITGGAGKTPIVVGGGVTVDIIGEGTISGGNAATGAGGNGITVGNGSDITIGNDVTVSGGDGAGANSGGHGINGGDSTTHVDVDGTVQGGSGGTGGSGGIGVYIPGTVEVGNGGTVTGGSGGDGTIGGNGNIGVSSGGSITIDGSVQGGSGGAGSSGVGGNGANGSSTSGSGTITIGTGGSVAGGSGGSGATTGGNGGSGSNTNNGNTTVNGKTEGGDGGAGATGGKGGNGSTVTGSGTVDIGNSGTASGGAGGNGSTGNGGTGGSGTTTGGGNTTVNGGTFGGSGGGSTGTAGGNGGSGSISTGGSVTVGTGGNVAGGDGGDGTTSGGNGGNGTQTGGANSTVNNGTTAGGAGGSGSTGNGGTGGNGTTTDQGSITGGGNATGGNGGASTGAAGGNGGDGSTSTGGGNITVGGDSSGGSGGNGATTGGDGGDGTTTGGNTEINGGGSASGGAGGTGTTGGGNGGYGSISGGDIIVDNGSTSGGNGGGSTGAAGGNGGDGSTSGGGNITIDNGSTSGGSGGNGATTGGTGGDGSTTTGSGTVDVNNGTTTGGAGGSGTAGTGGEGGNGATTDNGNITVGKDGETGTVTGGNGGSGATGGAGGSGSISTGTGSVDINTGSGATGGNGGAGGSGTGGAGGSGTQTGGSGTITNDGTTAGGAGGSSSTGNGGTGGNGATTDQGSITGGGNATGGNGGTSTGAAGGNGGDGSTSTGGGNVTVGGDSSGGSGGNGATTGGTGGDGSTTTGSGTVEVNNGSTTGGNGGTGTAGTGGEGGNGAITDNGNITVGDGNTTGSVTGGTGGSGGTTGGAGGSGSTSTGTGSVDINTGSGATGGDGGAGGSGTGGAGGSGTTTNTGDTTVDGSTSGGKDGTTAGGSGGNSTTGGGGNGGSGSTSTGGGDITVGGGTTGGSGASGKTEGGDGGDGTTTDGNTEINNGGSTSGGTGGTGTAGGGGNGGDGSTSGGGNITIDNGSTSGGSGGNGATTGGSGGDGSTTTGSGSVDVNNGSTTGGAGGTGTSGTGGEGGNGATTDNGNITVGKDGETGTVTGGNGGSGVTGGAGGSGSTSTGTGSVDINTGSGATGGDGGAGGSGTGGAGGSGTTTNTGDTTVDGSTSGGKDGTTAGGSGGNSTTGGGGSGGSGSTSTGGGDITVGGDTTGGSGGSGKTEGGNGGDGTITGGSTEINGGGSTSGGTGGTSTTGGGGNGGDGSTSTGGGNITIDNGSTTGGSGGNGATTGGSGGDGSTTTGSGSVDVNNGSTTGGAGGTGTSGTGGNGGNGVTTDNGNITVGDGSTTGTVTGGTGGSGGTTGGAGGSGSTSTGTGSVDINTGSGATGGNGGAGGSGGNSTTGGGGNGGSGSTSTGGGDITVGGDTTGGNGGSGIASGGNGGNGTTTDGNTTVNQGGNTSGGNGGNATGGGNNTTGNGGAGGNGSTSTGSGSTTVNGGATGGSGGNASGNGSGGNGGAGASQGSGTVGGGGTVNGGNGGNGSGTGDGGTGGAAVGGGASAGMGLTEKPGANGRKAITEVNDSQAGTKVTVPDQSTLTDAALTEAEKKDLDITEVKVVLNVKKENNPADKDKVDAVLSTVTADIIGAFFDITLDKIITKTSSGIQPSEKVENANAKIEITITIPIDMRGGSNYVVIRVHNGAGEALNTTQLGDDLTFKTDKFSTYAIAYTKSAPPTPPPTDNTSGGGSSSDNDEYDFWMNIKDKIQKADSGDVIKVSAKYYDKMPASVMSALYKSGVGMVITWSGGKTITIPAGKAQKAEGNRIYYPLSLLAELYQGIEFVETPAKDSANPETGGGYIAYADGKQIPITGGVTELAPPAIDNAPDTAMPDAPATITPPTAGFEADAFAGTPDAKAARGTGTVAIAGFAMLLAALCGGGVWFWKRRTQIEKQ